MINADGLDYHVVTHGVQESLKVDGLVCEVGLRAGGGTAYILQALKGQGKTHIAIDPYGNIEYFNGEHNLCRLDYTNAMRDQCIIDIYSLSKKLKVNFLFFPLEDTEFFKRYSDGVPVYEEEKKIINQYSCVFFDGPHATAPIEEEVKFFEPRTIVGSVFVFDDISTYDYQFIEENYLSKWKLLEKTNIKISYQKVVA